MTVHVSDRVWLEFHERESRKLTAQRSAVTLYFNVFPHPTSGWSHFFDAAVRKDEALYRFEEIHIQEAPQYRCYVHLEVFPTRSDAATIREVVAAIQARAAEATAEAEKKALQFRTKQVEKEQTTQARHRAAVDSFDAAFPHQHRFAWWRRFFG